MRPQHFLWQQHFFRRLTNVSQRLCVVSLAPKQLRYSQSFQPHKIFMRVTCASVENTVTVHLLTPLSMVSCILPFFGRCSTTIDIVTALTTIHHQSKVQINMQVVTCENVWRP